MNRSTRGSLGARQTEVHCRKESRNEAAEISGDNFDSIARKLPGRQRLLVNQPRTIGSNFANHLKSTPIGRGAARDAKAMAWEYPYHAEYDPPRCCSTTAASSAFGVRSGRETSAYCNWRRAHLTWLGRWTDDRSAMGIDAARQKSTSVVLGFSGERTGACGWRESGMRTVGHWRKRVCAARIRNTVIARMQNIVQRERAAGIGGRRDCCPTNSRCHG